jgi:hypothetical protein
LCKNWCGEIGLNVNADKTSIVLVGDQKTLLRLHQVVVLFMLRYGDIIYGSASKAALRTIDPEHHKGEKLR